MIYIDAEQLQDGLYNIKDGKIYKYKAKGGTVRTYELKNIVHCGECKWEWTQKCPPHRMGLIHDESDYCSYGIRKGADDEGHN